MKKRSAGILCQCLKNLHDSAALSIPHTNIYHKIPVIIMNGRGGCGKDTLIQNLDQNEFYPIAISTVDPIKAAADSLGWNGDKTPEARLFISELKNASMKYNAYPQTWVLDRISHYALSINDPLVELPDAANGSTDVSKMCIFIHCREIENILRLQHAIINDLWPSVHDKLTKPAAILVRRGTPKNMATQSDDCVDAVPEIYQYIIDNDGTIEEGAATLGKIISKMRTEK